VVSFAFSHLVVWPIALMMAGAALLGGYAGSKGAVRVGPGAVRKAIVVIGFVITIVMVWQLWQ
jgi:uncharacterized protein